MPTSIDPQRYLSPTMIGGAVSAVTSSSIPLGDYPAFGMSMWFTVSVDALPTVNDLGDWAKCSGLQVDFKTIEIKEGADYMTAGALLPDRVNYSKISLERAMNARDSQKVYQWLQKVQSEWMKPGGDFKAQAMHIKLCDATQSTVMSWTLLDVVPIGWKCTAFAAGQGTIAIETLDLQHKGFL